MTKSKGVSIYLDGETSLALNAIRNDIIRGLDESGMNGLAMAPTIGYLARQVLRKAIGLKEIKGEELIADTQEK